MLGKIVGNYVIKRKIAEGGMGVVYLAEHRAIPRTVAIKVLHAHLSRNTELIARFLNEARAASRIGGQHVVQVLDFGELDTGEPFLAMEWLEGETLRAMLERTGRVSLQETAELLANVAAALDAAHGLGIVHRDLKPDNIFLVRGPSGTTTSKVLDFGIAKIREPGTDAGFKTQTGALLGTPAYMAPEQCVASKTLDHRCDIYALGVIAFQMLTGRLPFTADNYGELLVAHMTAPPPVPRDLIPYLPSAASKAILKALSKSPNLRFDNAKTFIKLLSKAVPVPPPAPVDPTATVPDGHLATDDHRKVITTIRGSAIEVRSRSNAASLLKRIKARSGPGLWAAAGLGILIAAYVGVRGLTHVPAEHSSRPNVTPAVQPVKPTEPPWAGPSVSKLVQTKALKATSPTSPSRAAVQKPRRKREAGSEVIVLPLGYGQSAPNTTVPPSSSPATAKTPVPLVPASKSAAVSVPPLGPVAPPRPRRQVDAIVDPFAGSPPPAQSK